MQEVTCIDYTYEGKGICRVNNKLIFVDYLLIGEVAKVQIVKQNKKFATAKIIELLEPSPLRSKSICHLFKQCGGCHLLHMSYLGQLEFKHKIVTNALSSIAKITTPINFPIGMEQPLYYRNKVQVPVAYNKEKLAVAGFYALNSHKVIPFTKCYLQSQIANTIIVKVVSLIRDFKIEPYNEDQRTGIIRHIFVRVGAVSQQVQLVLVTTSLTFASAKNFISAIKAACPEITTISFNLNTRSTNVIMGEHEKIVYGPGFIYDQLDEYKFSISAKSFFQVNPSQTVVLYNKAIELAQLDKDDIVLDAYSGIGSISIFISKFVEKVIAIEIVKAAVDDAISNAKLNNIDNITFIHGDIADHLDYLARACLTTIIVDPPRRGCDKALLEQIIKLAIKKVIYISCDPGTLARDLAILKSAYSIQTIQPVDMFPNTYHIETIAICHLK